MTREEAIKILNKYDLNFCDIDGYPIPPQDLAEACDMAIEALEQEETLQNLTKPNKRTDKRTETHACDLISRQAAIDALMNDVTPYGLMDDEGNIESGCKDKDVVAMLYNLPSAQPFTEEQIQTMQELESAQIEKAFELGKADRLTGHWIKNDNGTFSCSNCQSWIPEEQHHYARYCLYCGARMESEEE